MKQQNYQHHARYYTPHHFIYLPLLGLQIGVCAWCANHYPDDNLIWWGLAAAFAMILFTGLLMRQHYALGNQDRIVRLEMRLRYFQLTGQRLEPHERQLGNGRIAALRFASDEELPTLLGRALSEGLSADEIKRAIRDWQPDEMRR